MWWAWCLAILCSGLVSCGGASAPSGGGSTPIPIEIPMVTGDFSFPDSLSISVDNVASGSGNFSLPWSVGKGISGSGAPERALSFIDDANSRLDTLLALLADIEVENSTSTTSVTGTTVGNSAYRLDFSRFTFPSFSNQQISSVDCSSTCSGNAGDLPMCVRLHINNRRVFVGKFTALPDDEGQGAGCFKVFGTHTTRTSEDAQIRGVETYELSGVWDQQTSTNHQLELFWATSLPDQTGFDVDTSHAYLTRDATASSSALSVGKLETGLTAILVKAAVFGRHAEFAAGESVEFTAAWTPESDRLLATYDLEGSSVSQSCVTLTGAAASDCPSESLLSIPGGASSSDVTVDSTIAASSGLVGVFAGNVQSYALDSDGSVFAWGSNYTRRAVDDAVSYILGVGTGETNYDTPVEMSLTGATQISVGPLHGIARRNDGTVWVWGSNYEGQLGNGTRTYSATPIQVAGLTDMLYVAAGDEHSLALRNDGTIWAWGQNVFGQLGDGTTTDRLTPVQVATLSNVVALVSGLYDNLALRSDGTVWGWGYAVDGLVNPFDEPRSLDSQIVTIPTQIPGLSGIVAIAVGNSGSMALKNDGTVWVWGQYDCDVSTEYNTAPRQVTALSNIVDIGLGVNSNHFLAVDTSGRVFAWGENDEGQLGDGTTTDRTYCSPTTVSGLDRVLSIAAGLRHSLALKNDGTVWAWGDPGSGQLGSSTLDGDDLPPVTTPIQVTEF